LSFLVFKANAVLAKFFSSFFGGCRMKIPRPVCIPSSTKYRGYRIKPTHNQMSIHPPIWWIRGSWIDPTVGSKWWILDRSRARSDPPTNLVDLGSDPPTNLVDLGSDPPTNLVDPWVDPSIFGEFSSSIPSSRERDDYSAISDFFSCLTLSS